MYKIMTFGPLWFIKCERYVTWKVKRDQLLKPLKPQFLTGFNRFFHGFYAVFIWVFMCILKPENPIVVLAVLMMLKLRYIFGRFEVLAVKKMQKRIIF